MRYTEKGPGDFDPPELSPADELKAELEELRAAALRAIRAAFASGYRAAMYDELYEAGGATDHRADDCDCPEEYLDESITVAEARAALEWAESVTDEVTP